MAYRTTEVGAALRRLREGKRWPRPLLADFAAIDKSTLEKIEDGRRRPSIDTLVRLADALGADPLELLRPMVTDARTRLKTP